MKSHGFQTLTPTLSRIAGEGEKFSSKKSSQTVNPYTSIEAQEKIKLPDRMNEITPEYDKYLQ